MCRDRLLSPARSRHARHASEGCYGSRRWHEAGHGPRRSLQRRSRSACPRLARKHRDRNPQTDSSVTIYPLVTNRADNSISVLSISGKDVKVIDTVAVGDSVAHVAISPDGTKALAIKPVVNKAAVLRIEGQRVSYDKYDLVTGVFPYNVDIAPGGQIALIANNGAGGGSDGSVDTVSVIDLDQTPPRVIDHVVVGDGPEGFAISPKGDLALALLLRGSNSDKKAFYYNKNGAAVVLKIDGKEVTRVGDEIELGGLPEGVAFSPDGAYAYVGNFLDSNISVLKVDGTQVTDTGKNLKLPGPPASLRAAPK